MTTCTNAALMASMLPYDIGNPNSFTTAVRNMVVYGDPAGGTQVQVPGLTAANVNVDTNPVSAIPTDITITIQNYQISAVFQNFTLTNKPRVTTAYMGPITCSSGC
jgi:hypothetical protein